MGEQRPMFRFRLPWMVSSAPAPPPPPVATQSAPRTETPSTTSQPQTEVEPNVNPVMPARRPFRLPGIAPAAPPPIQPAVESKSEPIMITSTPRNLPQASPLWSPRVPAAQDPQLQAEVPPETKSQSENPVQPASPSPSKIYSQPTQLPSPSAPSPQLKATSGLPSPQLSATPQPPSPRKIPSEERDTTQLPSPKSGRQPSSPWRPFSKARDASRPSSPDQKKSSEAVTFQQPNSPTHDQSSGRKSPITTPSLTSTNVQQKERTTQSPSRAESPISTSQPQTNIEPNVKPMTPVQRPFRLPVIAQAQPPRPIPSTVQSQSEPITITSGPTFPPQAPPLWSPKISAAIVPLPQPEVSLESKPQSQNSSKPASPSKTHSQAVSELPSPSSTSAHSSATSQLPSQLSTTPHPPSPWRILSQVRDTTQLPSSKSSPQSSWRDTSKAKDGSQPSSPERHQFQKSSQAETFQQPRSPSQLEFQPLGKTSPITTQFLKTTNVQQTERTATQLHSPSMMSTHLKSPQPSASSDKPLSPVSVKPSGVAVTQPQSLEDQTSITPSVTFKAPTKATFQPTDNVAKPPKRDIEMVQDTSLVAPKKTKERTMAVHFTETSGLAPHNKEKLNIASQAEQKQLKNQQVAYEKKAKIPKASSIDEKQTKTISRRTDKESTVTGSRKKPVISNEDRAPFQKELRNEISMFADKMAIAHTKNLKDEKLASVVALVGKNKGAVMKLGSESAKGEGSLNIKGATKTEPAEGTKENERNKSVKHKRSNTEIDQENQTTKAFINNNVQDINNSILMNSSITERNPGVHLALYYDPTESIMSYGPPRHARAKSRSPLPKRDYI